MKSTSRLLLLLSGTAILCLTPHIRATPVSASMGFEVGVDFTGGGGTNAVDQQSASWGALTSPLSVSASVSNSFGSATATTFGQGSSTWAADGNSGTITIDYGWSTDAPGVSLGVATVSTNPLYGHNWSYTFVADQTGLFVVNANIVGTGSSTNPGVTSPMFGLNGFDIIGNVFMPFGVNFTDPTASGTVSAMVYAGNTYTMVLRNSGNVSGTMDQRDAAVHADFTWSLPGATATVPDAASTLALLSLGMGGLGLAAHSRRIKFRQPAAFSG